jgi:hypothetical protein
VSTLADEHKALSYDAYQAAQPGFKAPEGSPTVSNLEAMALLTAENGVALNLTAEALTLRSAQLRGIDRNAAVAATIQATITANDGLPHTYETGAAVRITDSAGNATEWVNQADVTFTTTTAVGGVTLVATTPGAAGNDITGTAVGFQPAYSWVQAITLVGLSSGGVDEETYPDFLSRVGEQFILGSQLILKADQLEAKASGEPEVGRALARRTYKPGGPNPSAGDMTVALADTTDKGEPVDAAVKTRVEAYPTADCNTLHVVDFDRHPVSFEATIVRHDDYEPAVAKAEAEDAIRAFYSALNYASRAIGTTQSMTVENILRLDQAAAVLNNQPSVRYVDFSTVKIGIDGGAASHSDKTLTGDFPLTYVDDPADVVVTVT